MSVARGGRLCAVRPGGEPERFGGVGREALEPLGHLAGVDELLGLRLAFVGRPVGILGVGRVGRGDGRSEA